MLAYLRELFVQLPPLDRRMIVQHSGVTRYEWAKALIASGVTSPPAHHLAKPLDARIPNASTLFKGR